MARKWTVDETKKLKQLFDEGVPDEDIAIRLGKTKNSVSNRRKRAGIKGSPSRRRFTKAGKERMRIKKKGSESPSWKGGKRINHNGYVEIFKPEHHRARGNGYVFEHILVMEEMLDRPITRSENIHHIDGNKSNNDPANLKILTHGEHSALHGQLKEKKGYIITCPVCGNEFYVKPSHLKIRTTCSMVCAGKLFREYYTDKPRDYKPTSEEKQEVIKKCSIV